MRKRKNRVCDDTCPYCMYIGEGDFFCEATEELVWTDWEPVLGYCTLSRKEQAEIDETFSS